MRMRPGTMDEAVVQQMMADPYRICGLVKDGDVVLDGGANIGAFADLVLKCAPNAKVICVEPLARNADLCRENLGDRGDCVVLRAALAGKSGTVTLYDLGDQESACHSVVDYGARAARTERVPALTLQELMLSQNVDRIDILKLDVQGAEFEILAQCPRAILEDVRYVAVEVHPCIVGSSGELGRIPDSETAVQGLVRTLWQTHVLVSGYPDGYGLSLLCWKSRKSATPWERVGARVRAHGANVSLFAWRSLGLRSVIPSCVRRAWRRVVGM